MAVLRIEYSVPDFATWKELFDSDPADRKGAGVSGYKIFRSVDDPNYVLIDLAFADGDRAEAFLESVRGVWSGPASEVVQNPRARIVEEVEARQL